MKIPKKKTGYFIYRSIKYEKMLWIITSHPGLCYIEGML